MTATINIPTVAIEHGLRADIARNRRNEMLILRIDWQTGVIDVHTRPRACAFDVASRAWYGYESTFVLSHNMSNAAIREMVDEFAADIAIIRAGWSEDLNNDRTRVEGRFNQDATDALLWMRDQIEQKRWDADARR